LEYAEDVALLNKIGLMNHAIGVEEFSGWGSEAISRFFIWVSYQIR
jgi:hypothetical protein